MAKFEGIRRGYVGRVDRSVPVVSSNAIVPEQVQFEFNYAMESLFPPLPERISELRDALGGTNKAAKAIGVTPRSIQRYIAAEEQRGSQARRAGYEKREGIVKKLQDAAFGPVRGQRRAAMERDGVKVTAVGSLRVGTYTSGRFISIRLPGKAWRTILRHWDAGDRKGAAKAFQQWFGRTYGRAGGKPRRLPRGKRREDFTWAYLQELTFEPPS